MLKMNEGGTFMCLGRGRKKETERERGWQDSDLSHHAHERPQTEHLQRHADQILQQRERQKRQLTLANFITLAADVDKNNVYFSVCKSVYVYFG